MRILQVNSARALGGGETHVLQLVEALRVRGHEVRVAGRRDGPLNPDIALTALRLRQTLKQEHVDVVHAHVARDYTIHTQSSNFASVRGVGRKRQTKQRRDGESFDRCRR